MGKININSYTYDSVVDGPGLRTVVFFQGCLHKCLGCHNKDSWKIEENNIYIIEDFIKEVITKSSKKKITISGGEPFMQKESLLELCSRLKSMDFHICVYTGYLYEQLLQDKVCKEVLKYIDILIDGKFEVDNIDISNSYVGSHNQKIYFLKEGKIIYNKHKI